MVESHSDAGAARSSEGAAETDREGTPPGGSAVQPAPEARAADPLAVDVGSFGPEPSGGRQ